MLCSPITEQRAKELDLELMVSDNTALHGTRFVVTIDYKYGTTTGISVADRALTIRALADETARPVDFARPGHVSPLIAVDEGVLRRAGHTEASVDLARLAGLYPAACLTEILKDDGTLARTPDLQLLAREHGLKFVTCEGFDQISRRPRTHCQESRERESADKIWAFYVACIPKYDGRTGARGIGERHNFRCGAGARAGALRVLHRRYARLTALRLPVATACRNAHRGTGRQRHRAVHAPGRTGDRLDQ